MIFDNDFDVSYFESLNTDIKFNYFNYDFNGMMYTIKSCWFSGYDSRKMLNEANKRLALFIKDINSGAAQTQK